MAGSEVGRLGPYLAEFSGVVVRDEPIPLVSAGGQIKTCCLAQRLAHLIFPERIFLPGRRKTSSKSFAVLAGRRFSPSFLNSNLWISACGESW
jgi:hypothetical protein